MHHKTNASSPIYSSFAPLPEVVKLYILKGFFSVRYWENADLLRWSSASLFPPLEPPKDVGPIGSGSLAALRRSWVRSPKGANFHLRLKNPSRLPHVQSTVEPGLTHKATGPRVRMGQGFGGFLGLLWEGHSTSQTMPWGRSYPQVKFFF